MTDEDERMDRARRIREMREGNRPGGEQAADRDDEAAGDDDGETAGDQDAAETDGPSGDVAADDQESGKSADGGDADTTGVDDTDGDADTTGDADDADTADDAGNDSDAGDADEESGGTIQIPGAEVGDVSIDPAELAREAGLDTADVSGDGDEVQSAGSDDSPGVDGGAATADETKAADGAAPAGDADTASPVGMAGSQTASEQAATAAETRVLEFNLGPERYCLDIDYVEEIVKREAVTRVPNTPDYVEGVVDLRGQITTILDPKVLLDIDAEGSKELIVVFDPEDFDDQGAIGWVVDDVNRVTPIAEDEVNDSPVDQEHINGVVDRDDEFVIWTTPKVDVEDAAG